MQNLGIFKAWCTYKINGLRICATYFKRKIENNMDVIFHVFMWAMSIRRNILQHVFLSFNGWVALNYLLCMGEETKVGIWEGIYKCLALPS
jgi:hypothetical protein